MLEKVIKGIKPLDREVIGSAKDYVDNLAKPLGSLGTLEDIVVQISGITGKIHNSFESKGIIIMCSDNGVVEEGVAASPQYITLAQTKNFIKGKTGVCAISKVNNTKLIVVDVGINSDEVVPGVINRKISKGTKNIFKENAMTYEEGKKSLEIGIEVVKKAKQDGIDILGVGEMGIGNTTTSAAVLASLLNMPSHLVVGKGAGLTNSGYEKKLKVVQGAIENKIIDNEDPIDIISKVGGYDIGAMTGVFLGCAYYRIPVVIDGYISVVAALCAVKLNPMVKEYLIPSHKSKEIGYNLAIKELGLSPIIDLGMRLGEGSGCPIAFSIVDFALSMVNNMATFKECEIDNSYIEEIRGEENYKI